MGGVRRGETRCYHGIIPGKQPTCVILAARTAKHHLLSGHSDLPSSSSLRRTLLQRVVPDRSVPSRVFPPDRSSVSFLVTLGRLVLTQAQRPVNFHACIHTLASISSTVGLTTPSSRSHPGISQWYSNHPQSGFLLSASHLIPHATLIWTPITYPSQGHCERRSVTRPSATSMRRHNRSVRRACRSVILSLPRFEPNQTRRAFTQLQAPPMATLSPPRLQTKLPRKMLLALR